MTTRTITVRSTWSARDTIEVPDDVSDEQIADDVANLEEWVANGIDPNGASLSDWEQS